MEHKLSESFKTLSAQELKDNLESLCSSVSESVIRRELSQEEKLKLQQELARGAVELAIKEEAFDQIKQDHKTAITPIKLKNNEIIGNLRTNSIEEEGFVYEIPNQEDKQMESYDSKGNLLQIRPLLPEERQRDLLHDSNVLKNTGTD